MPSRPMRFTAALLLSSLLLTSAPASTGWAQITPAAPTMTLPVGVKFVTEVEGIREYRLPNGLGRRLES